MGKMEDKPVLYLVAEKAVPEVLLKVVEAKRLLESGKVISVQEAADAAGISRSSFYKYKDDIFLYHPRKNGRAMTMVIQMEDEPGILSVVSKAVAELHGNILTIYQSLPVNGIASMTLTIETDDAYGDADMIKERVENIHGISYAKIMARE